MQLDASNLGVDNEALGVLHNMISSLTNLHKPRSHAHSTETQSFCNTV